MDDVLSRLVDFVEASTFASLSEEGVARVVRHTLDSVGCGAGGFMSGPATTARTVVRGSVGPLSASVYGEAGKVPVELAGFANATANRFLDFNDFGVSGHPSDMIPAILAMAEATGSSGADAVAGIHVAYEIATRLAEAVPADGGWDQGVYCSLGLAAAHSRLLGLGRTSWPTPCRWRSSPASRSGSPGSASCPRKAAATAHAAMTAAFATRLAAAGMTGPPEPFTGKDGLMERVWPSFELDLEPRRPTAIERASLKRHPACYWGQVPVDLLTEVRDRVDLDDVEAIEVETCEAAWRTIGGSRGDADEKWRPRTRETPDHSMPYLMAVALVDGKLSEAAFGEERLHDPALLRVMDRITVRERADLSSHATRDTCPTELTVHRAGGSTVTAAADVPRGHHANPMTDEEVGEKFRELTRLALPQESVEELADRLWDLAAARSVDPITASFRAFGTGVRRSCTS